MILPKRNFTLMSVALSSEWSLTFEQKTTTHLSYTGHDESGLDTRSLGM